MSPATKPEDALLVIIPTVGMIVEGDRVFMDIKSIEGLFLSAAAWPGRLLCLSREAMPGAIGYGQWYDIAALPFDVATVPADADVGALIAASHGAALIEGGADAHEDLALVDNPDGTPVVMIIEYTLKTRFDMLRYERRSRWQKFKTGIWLIKTERARRRCLRRAAGLQANGTPAFIAYGPANAEPFLYFDTRLKRSLFIGLEGAAAKADAVLAGKPLRLAFSGRLEPIKGADFLVPVMVALRRSGVTATLDIYGDGSLRGEIEAGAAAAGLSGAVRVHGPVPFETALVPTLKAEVDLFLCCHPQGDPSCTYLETYGCGVPIAGFLNQAFAGVLTLGDGGVGVAIGDVEGLAKRVAELDRDRPRLAELTRGAAQIASEHLFEKVFAMRSEHLQRVAFGRVVNPPNFEA